MTPYPGTFARLRMIVELQCACDEDILQGWNSAHVSVAFANRRAARRFQIEALACSRTILDAEILAEIRFRICPFDRGRGDHGVPTDQLRGRFTLQRLGQGTRRLGAVGLSRPETCDLMQLMRTLVLSLLALPVIGQTISDRDLRDASSRSDWITTGRRLCGDSFQSA